MAESNGTHEAPWVMPTVQAGQIVGWAWTKGGAVSPAIVLEVGACTLNLSIHVSNVKDHVYKSGVRHRDDPFLRRTPDYQGGVWQVLPRDEALDEMLAAFRAKQAERAARTPSSSERQFGALVTEE
jgi:hypothetical protein